MFWADFAEIFMDDEGEEMPARKQKKHFNWVKTIVVIGFPIVCFLGGAVINAWTVVDKIATKPYVEAKIDEQRKYTDDKALAVLEKAIEHSDMNRQQMMLQVEKMSTDSKVSQSSLQTKVDLIYHMVQNMSDEVVFGRRKK
jgi:hypothetical protein